MRTPRRAAPATAALIAVVALLLAGCSGSLIVAARNAGSPVRTAAPAGLGAQVAVIRRWARALRRGDIDAAAALFAVPSVFSDGQPVEIRDRSQARAANASLTCGAEFISATVQGRLINVLFRLTGRPGPGGTSCASGVGQTARTQFLIERGKIVAWIEAPDTLPPSPGPTQLRV